MKGAFAVDGGVRWCWVCSLFLFLFLHFQALKGLLEQNTNFKSALLDPALLVTYLLRHSDQIPALLTSQKPEGCSGLYLIRAASSYLHYDTFPIL